MLHEATHCHWCHCEISDDLPANHPQKATADHLLPVSAGGTDTRDNLVPSCFACNTKRGKMSVEAWLLLLNHDVEGAEDW